MSSKRKIANEMINFDLEDIYFIRYLITVAMIVKIVNLKT